MNILLFINALCFMCATAFFWFVGTIGLMVISFFINIFKGINFLFNQINIEVEEIVGIFAYSLSKCLTLYDNLFNLFWNFSRYDHPIFALIITLVIAGASSTRG